MIFGLIIGSFLNVLIYRLPLNISLINPKRSQCPKCFKTISWYENIPVLSYLFLKAKCSKCKTSISFIYPFIEILTAFVTCILFIKLGFTQELIYLSCIFYILIVLSFIDFKYKAVPDYLLIILTIITLVYIFLFHIHNLSNYFIFIGGIVTIDLFVTYYIQNIKSYILKDDSLKNQKAIGEGDIPIIALIGGILGLKFGVIALFLSAILAIIPSIINSVFKKEIETPFIPYLAMGFFITFTNQDNIHTILERLYIG